MKKRKIIHSALSLSLTAALCLSMAACGGTQTPAEVVSAAEGCTAADGAAGCEAAPLSAGVCVPPQAAMDRHNAAVSDKLNAEWMILFFFINRSPCCIRCGQAGAALPFFFDPARCKNPAAGRLRSPAPAENSLHAAGRHGAKNPDRCTR